MQGARRQQAVREWTRSVVGNLERHGFDRENLIAMVMALIATFGAIAGFFASRADFGGSACNRTLESAQKYELGRRQSYLAQYFEHARWSDEHELARLRARDLNDRAKRLRDAGGPNAPGANVLDIDAQLEYAVARGIAPLVHFSDPQFADRFAKDPDQALAERARRDLEDLGVPNHCRDVVRRAGAVDSSLPAAYLAPLAADIDALHQKSLRDHYVVLGFVVALAIFAIAEIAPRAHRSVRIRRRRERARFVRNYTPVRRRSRRRRHDRPAKRSYGGANRGRPQAPAGPATSPVTPPAAARRAARAARRALTHRRALARGIGHDRWRWLRVLMVVVCTAAFAGALIFGIATDALLGAWWDAAWFGAAFAGVVLFAFLRWQYVLRKKEAAARAFAAERTREPDLDTITDLFARLHHHSARHLEHNRLGKWIVLLMAATAFASALVDLEHSYNTDRFDATSGEAGTEQVSLLRTATLDESAAYYAIRKMAAVREARLRSKTTAELRDSARELGTSADAAVWSRDAERWAPEPARIISVGPLDPRPDYSELPFESTLDGPYGPYADFDFPVSYVAQTTVRGQAERLALWDARDEESAAYDQRAALLLGSLTLFGIALYLFGQSFGIGTTHGGFTLLTFGIVVGAIGLGLAMWAMRVQFPDKTPLPELPVPCRSAQGSTHPEQVVPSYDRASVAANCFKEAEVLSKLGNDQDAFRLYVAAANARPGFVLADYRAAQAASRIASPQLRARHASLIVPRKLEEMMSEDRRVARDLEDRHYNIPGSLFENYELHEYLVALDTGNRPMLDATIEYTDDALDVAPDSTVLLLRFRLAVALLARGREAAARQAYDRAFADLAERRKAGLPADGEPARVAAAAISDLELVRARCKSLAWLRQSCNRLTPRGSAIDGYEREVVANTWGTTPGNAATAVRSDRFQTLVTPSGVGWRTPADQALTTDRLVMLVYRYDVDWRTWYVVPDLSYQIDPARLIVAKGWLTLYRSLLVRSGYTRCLPLDGTYRIELYLGGRRVVQKAFDVIGPSERFDGTALRDPGAAMCHPSEWTQDAVADGSLMAGFRKDDGTQGAYSFAFLTPRGASATARAQIKHALLRQGVELTLRRLRPGNAAVKLLHETVGSCLGYFGLAVPHVEYVYGKTTFAAKAWETAGGLLTVGVVWNDAPRMKRPSYDDLSCSVLTSMTDIDNDASVVERNIQKAGTSVSGARRPGAPAARETSLGFRDTPR
jgi:tetratricopeptide (TPR) repeat protein